MGCGGWRAIPGTGKGLQGGCSPPGMREGVVLQERLSYKTAGVDIGAYKRMLERVTPLISATHGPEVVTGIGPFAGIYELPGGGRLAASADSAGTKVKVATAFGWHRGIGHDLVNHCVHHIAN